MDFSYAQHLEDYHLSLIFSDQKSGFYIDIGGGHPVADNVSCWFYLRGWQGLVVEPQQSLAEMYGRTRPRDQVFCGLVGRETGDVPFYSVDRLHGFSTTIAQNADIASGLGVGVRKITKPMLTLADLCDRYKVPRVDFLKIDVEGAEADVLLGNDWQKYRPRVIVLEAVAPGSMSEAWQDWEPILLENKYRFALFEGLNRFYIAEEDMDLSAKLPEQAAEWLVVPHLGHTNRAPFRTDHPDHLFAKRLVGNFLALLPSMTAEQQFHLLTCGLDSAALSEPLVDTKKRDILDQIFPDQPSGDARCGLSHLQAKTVGEFYELLVASDAFRILLGRLAMSYDGGQILEEEA